MVHGIQPGPLLFINNPVGVYSIFIGLMLANIVMGMLGFSLIKVFTKVVNVPKPVLLPIIVVMAVIGTYSYNHSMPDVFIMLVAGLIGYVMAKVDMSVPGVIIGIILGQLAEQNFTGSLLMSDGSPIVFVENPICFIFLILALVSLLSPLYKDFIMARFLKK